MFQRIPYTGLWVSSASSRRRGYPTKGVHPTLASSPLTPPQLGPTSLPTLALFTTFITIWHFRRISLCPSGIVCLPQWHLPYSLCMPIIRTLPSLETGRVSTGSWWIKEWISASVWFYDWCCCLYLKLSTQQVGNWLHPRIQVKCLTLSPRIQEQGLGWRLQ